MCPTSNIATRAVADARRAPDQARSSTPGAPVTVNSDDPPMFGTTLNQEYAVAAHLLDLDEQGLVALAGNAVTASFAADDVKQRLLAELDDYARSARAAG